MKLQFNSLHFLLLFLLVNWTHQGAQRAQEWVSQWGQLIVVRFGGEASRRRFLCTPLDMLLGLVRARCFAPRFNIMKWLVKASYTDENEEISSDKNRI